VLAVAPWLSLARWRAIHAADAKVRLAAVADSRGRLSDAAASADDEPPSVSSALVERIELARQQQWRRQHADERAAPSAFCGRATVRLASAAVIRMIYGCAADTGGWKHRCACFRQQCRRFMSMPSP
jgi:hypothetical protein